MLISPSDLETIKKLDLKHPYVWLATWFGSGFLRPAPGTWGSAISIPPALITYAAFGEIGLLTGIILISIAGYWASDLFDKATAGHDNKMIVIDEAAGQWITLLPALSFTGLNPLWVLLSFLLFRAFDITKPWPVSWLDQKVKGPLGVMGDDIIAGTMAALCITGIHYAGFS